MKFRMKKLGLIDDAEIELAALTLICGENNTGKTYATYAIYGFLRSWRQLFQVVVASDIESVIRRQGNYKFDLRNMFFGRINDYLIRMGKKYVESLHNVFATNAEFFKESVFEPHVDELYEVEKRAYQRRVQAGREGKIFATISKEVGSDILEVLVSEDDLLRIGALANFVADAIADIVFSPKLPPVHISSAERTGVTIFRKELDFARTRMVEALGTLNAKEFKNPFRLMEKMEAGYAWPVNDNVDFVRQLEDIGKDLSFLSKNHPEVIRAFDAIIGGTYKVVKDQGLIFHQKGGNRLKFTMNESSSCVRALLDVGFYLRCKAKPGDLFIIDEPELNLHPKNQRAFARLVARLVNSGVKVFITTHSDYIIKELNTLIMLNQKTPHAIHVQKTYGYEESELIDPTKVRLYVTTTDTKPSEDKGKRGNKFNTVKLAKIYPDRGIEVTTFDTTIEEMNEIQSQILYGGDL